MQFDWLIDFGSLFLVAQAGAADDSPTVLRTAAHILHVLAAVTLVGGIFYQRFVLLPAERGLPASDAAALLAGRRARWSKWVAVSALFLLASGLYSFVDVVRSYELPKYYHPLFGIKFLLALLIFFIASILAGKTAAAERFRLRAPLWLTVNVLAAVAVIVIAGVLSRAEKTPKAPRGGEPLQAAPETS